MKRFLPLGMIIIMGTLSACSLLPSHSEPSQKYVLGVIPKEGTSSHPRSSQVVVDLPTLYPPIDGTRIALKPQEQRIDYYADIEWADRLGLLVQESLIYSLQNTNTFRSVSRSTEGIQAQYALKVEVRKFYIVHPDDDARRTAQVEYLAQLVKLPERHVVASKPFSATQPAPENTTARLVAALNDAHLQAVKTLVSWLLRSVG